MKSVKEPVYKSVDQLIWNNSWDIVWGIVPSKLWFLADISTWSPVATSVRGSVISNFNRKNIVS